MTPSLEICVENESWELVGDYLLTVEANLRDYPLIDPARVETNLIIYESCQIPTCVSMDYDSCD